MARVQSFAERLIGVLTTFRSKWAFLLISAYCLLTAGFLCTANTKAGARIVSALSDTIAPSYLKACMFVFVAVAAGISWLLITALFHQSAIYAGGYNKYTELLKASSFALAFPSLVYLTGISLNFFAMSRGHSLLLLNYLPVVGYGAYAFVLWAVLKFHYHLRWSQAFMTILCPVVALFFLAIIFLRYLH